VGAALGPVFSSCSPTYFLIIATVLPRSIQAGLIYLLVYTFGLCATLLLVAIAGQKLLSRFEAASDPNGWFKRGIGVLFLVVGVVIATGLQAKFELAFANSNFLNVSGIEKALLSKAGPINANGGTGSTASSTAPGTDYATATSTVGSTATSSAARITAESLVYPKAPEITKAAGFLNNNGQPISLASLKGKVVLVDFWDYSCINCQREIPYVEAWYKKYNPEGLVVVGVHTPEFAFEKVSSNVAAAAKSLGITYPIVLDNDYGTWNAFNNEYWPQVYLINSDGFVVYSHSGEGEYAQTEAAIQKALTERVKNEGLSTSISSGTVNPSTTEVGTGLGSPETYFGYNRNQYLANGKPGEADTQTLALPSTTQLNQLNLGGTWTFKAEYAETSDTTNGAIEYQFQAKNVYLVATGNPSAKVKILLDGKPLGANAGADVAADGTMTINADKLYKLVSLPDYGTHTILIQLISGTLDGYTFTFG
jgi:thiol-disulfide isomerase/thioredoxin